MYLGIDPTSLWMHAVKEPRKSQRTNDSEQVFRDLKRRKVSCSQFWCLGFSYSGKMHTAFAYRRVLYFCRCLKTHLKICKVLLRILLVLVSRYAFMLGPVLPGPEGFNNLRPVMDMIWWNIFPGWNGRDSQVNNIFWGESFAAKLLFPQKDLYIFIGPLRDFGSLNGSCSSPPVPSVISPNGPIIKHRRLRSSPLEKPSMFGGTWIVESCRMSILLLKPLF